MENNNEVQNKKNNSKMIIIIVFALLIGGVCGFVLSQSLKTNSNNKNEENNNNKKEESKPELDKITGKHSFSEYCSNTDSCKKDIGMVSINNQELKFSIDLDNINTENVSGNIMLGSKTKNITDLSYFNLEKSFDGFEIYQDYLIIYTSNLKKESYANCRELEGLRGYMMYILDENLNEVSGLAGFTLNDAYTDFIIEAGYVYYYGELSSGDVLVYEKISFNDLLQKNWDATIRISNKKECK